ncbi:MAG: hypothetical protein LLG20_19610 [Acidobacteriales bacterium]|nr:hypothetical protein [Terriglobales bacterium]
MSVDEVPVQHGVTLTRPQIIALAFVAVVVAGLAMSLGYVGGRTLKPAGGIPSAKGAENQSQDFPDASGASFVELPPPPSEHWETPGPRAGAAHTRGSVQHLSLKPRSGQRYLQVAAAGRGVADSVWAELARRGFQGGIVADTDASSYRVLVGPLQPNEIASTASSLRQIGFSPFLKVY